MSRDGARVPLIAMLFNSLIFPAFFAVVYGLYLLLRRHLRAQNAMLLAASYVFYGWWDWRFCGLLLASTAIDYAIGRALERAEDGRRRKWLLAASVGANLTILGFFKYFNFFYDSVAGGFERLGFEPPDLALQVLLPVGISFYTFQTLSYTIDLYRRRVPVCRDFLGFALYVAFFPQLVAGPIERAKHLLPQILSPRTVRWRDVDLGLWLILWGFFKKLVIADNLALVANEVFNNHAEHSGVNILIGALAFTGQIYCDFSGYTDIARGTARLMGFDIMLNFKLPYFALNPSDFWRRWHVSLSSWLRDYLYIPLGGNRGGALKTYRNLLLTMLLGGLWHGAAWNFVIWGLFHGLLLIAYRPFTKHDADYAPRLTPGVAAKLFAQWALMFSFTVVGWIIFRAESAQQIGDMLTSIGPGTTVETKRMGLVLVLCWAPLVAMQLVQHHKRDLTWPIGLASPIRGLFYAALAAGIALFAVRESVEFIYFQF